MSTHHPDHTSAATGASARRASPRPRRQNNPTFPVVIVRPAMIDLPSTTAAQRHRRRAADQLAAELTDAARTGRPCLIKELILDAPMDEVPASTTIANEATQIVDAPPPAAVRVGRNLRGEPVAVVLHGDRWSLVIEAPPTATRRPAASCVFITVLGPAPDVPYVVFRFDDDPSPLGVGWTEMINHVLATATAPHPTPAPRPPRGPTVPPAPAQSAAPHLWPGHGAC
ncbi:hypothetical protein [Micromonospora sp. HUAS LYJ1]|uniref:hypothetical protein n=1 Tax=Micromonospora sp. HUAS LYJ1 TaxID=3061626 RepID=UPI002671186F|nr:hypothetical protein [Micromonospora sp. HUAS LYJ1]WKU03456.1 hypothetical protein Q2K16_21725 [Micromonospora sp. HUAS LYJ1]